MMMMAMTMKMVTLKMPCQIIIQSLKVAGIGFRKQIMNKPPGWIGCEGESNWAMTTRGHDSVKSTDEVQKYQGSNIPRCKRSEIQSTQELTENLSSNKGKKEEDTKKKGKKK